MAVTFHAVLGVETFVLTAENDGYALAPGSSLLQSYFCYLPPVGVWPDGDVASVSQSLRAEGVGVKELTDAVAIGASGQIFAQPRTFRLDVGEIAGTELFVFDASGGQPVNARTITDPEFRAGGMIAGEALLLGRGNELYRVEAFDGTIERVGRVEAIQSIEGMGLGPEGDIMLLDGPGKRLYAIERTKYFPPGTDGFL